MVLFGHDYITLCLEGLFLFLVRVESQKGFYTMYMVRESAGFMGRAVLNASTESAHTTLFVCSSGQLFPRRMNV